MSAVPVQYDTFVIERRLASSPARVFVAFADQKKKARWFGCVDGWEVAEHTLDFRVGGRERTSGGPKGEWVSQYDAIYHDIVPNERIVSSYDMRIDGKLISVSLATVELKPEGAATRLTFTEQGAYLDAFDNAEEREEGTRQLFDALARVLERQTATA